MSYFAIYRPLFFSDIIKHGVNKFLNCLSSYLCRIPRSKEKGLQYDRANLNRAFEAIQQRGLSVRREATEYSVPVTTLRDQILGNGDIDAKIGFDTIFEHEEEEKLVGHITYMAGIGYGYNKSGIQYMAKDYAVSLGKPTKAKESLSNNWFYGFIKRWPNLKIVKPQKLSIARAKSASRESLDKYYKELSLVLTSNGLNDKPQNIYNVDETGVNTEHSPPKSVCDKSTIPQNITSNRSSTITTIASGNALRNSAPPYFVFPGQRWNEEFLEGACPGSAGEMTKSGWSNSQVFLNYLTKHFAKYVKMPEGNTSERVLVLYDGHRSHIFIISWLGQEKQCGFVCSPTPL